MKLLLSCQGSLVVHCAGGQIIITEGMKREMVRTGRVRALDSDERTEEANSFGANPSTAVSVAEVED